MIFPQQEISPQHFNCISDKRAYALALLISIAYLFWLYPLSFLQGSGYFFENGDATQHVTGWLFYMHDKWHFPLLKTTRLNYPQGISIAFTDSIPLAALLFKPFAAWLPDNFHYIGLWHAIVYTSQAIAATYFIRVLGCRDLFSSLIAILFSLTWPALLMRLGHTSLMTHGLLIFALAFYFMGRNNVGLSSRASALLITTCIIALTVHPYLFALCFAIFAAYLADQGLHGEPWKIQVKRGVLASTLTLFLMFALGYFGSSGTAQGFGYYSMNLVAPFCGGRIFDCNSDATGGQYEGFNYFGAGLILLIPFSIYTNKPDLVKIFKKYSALISLSLFLTIYALSNKAFLSNTLLLDYDVPTILKRITDTFRASGRFFWPVGYLILFIALSSTLKNRKPAATALITLAAVLQFFDTSLLQKRVQHIASRESAATTQAWNKIVSNVTRVNVFPAYTCADNKPEIYWKFQHLAAKNNKTINTGYISRSNIDCDEKEAMFYRDFSPNQLYVTDTANMHGFNFPSGFISAIHRNECIIKEEFLLCSPAAKFLDGERKAAIKADAGNEISIPADKLASQIGEIKNGRLAPKKLGQAGFLSYGPYITLPAGNYLFSLEYSSDAKKGDTIGNWDVNAIQNDQPITMKQGQIYGTNGVKQNLLVEVTVLKKLNSVEIRTNINGTKPISISNLTIRKLSIKRES